MPTSAKTWVTPVTLEGSRVRLEPLHETHLDDLVRVGKDDSIWRWITGLPMDEPGLHAWFDQTRANAEAGTEVPFATVDRNSDRAIGSTRFMTITPEHRRLEIGWTWVGTAFQKTGANREAKLLQLTHAFETLGANRVWLQTDKRNERSQKAIARLGATREGEMRNERVLADGHLRTSVIFGITKDEWPEIRDRLLGYLAR